MMRPILCLILCWAGTLTAAEAEVVAEAAPDEERSVPVAVADRSPRAAILADARILADSGRRAEAIELLEAWLLVNEADAEARRLFLAMTIEERRAEMRGLVTQQVERKDLVLGDPSYEAAKASAPLHISRQLDLVEFLIHEQRFHEAVDASQRILDRHGQDDATLTLLDRLLGHLVRLERRRLDTDRGTRSKETLNEVTERGTMPREQRPIARTVLIFDEDIADIQRQEVLRRLELRLRMFQYENQPLREVLKALFPIAGLNYIILDEAVGEQTLTIDLVDESVGHVLEIIQRSTPVEFNYRGGSVYVTSRDSENRVLVTEIIRLQAGLTDVLSNLSGGGEGVTASAGNGQSDLERFLERALTAQGLVDWPEGSNYYLDRKSNTVYVRSTPGVIQEVRRLLHGIDHQNVQVLIEARFVEVSDSAGRTLGVNWAFAGDDMSPGARYGYGGSSGTGAAGILENAILLPADQSPTAALAGQANPGFFAGLVGVGNNVLPNLSATIRALESQGDANVLSEPKILTINNAIGVINLTNDVSYVTDFENRTANINISTGTDGSSDFGNLNQALVPRFETAQEFIRLTVQPSVARNGDVISLRIHPHVRQLVGFGRSNLAALLTPGSGADVAAADIQQPEFREREISTTLHVQDGQTIVLGGLISSRDEKDSSGIPGLRRIPALGRLFGSTSSSMQRSKLLIFVTAHIIDPSGAKYSDDIRHLRDSARITLPEEVRQRIYAREQLEAEAAEAAVAERAERRQASRPRGPTGRASR